MNLSTKIKPAVEVKPLFFHIGWMRTGTTFLQGAFGQHDKINLSLKNRFFSYDPLFFKGTAYYQNEIILSGQSEQHYINVDSDENYAMGRFKTHLREKDTAAWNHKSELSFISHDIDEMIVRMKDSAPDAKIFGVIRKQPSWFESVYKHDVYHFGLDQSFEDFYASDLGKSYQEAAYYGTVYQKFTDAFGKEKCQNSAF